MGKNISERDRANAIAAAERIVDVAEIIVGRGPLTTQLFNATRGLGTAITMTRRICEKHELGNGKGSPRNKDIGRLVQRTTAEEARTR